MSKDGRIELENDSWPDCVFDIMEKHGLTREDVRPVWERISGIDLDDYWRNIQMPLISNSQGAELSEEELETYDKKVADTYSFDKEWELFLFYRYVEEDTYKKLPSFCESYERSLMMRKSILAAKVIDEMTDKEKE